MKDDGTASTGSGVRPRSTPGDPVTGTPAPSPARPPIAGSGAGFRRGATRPDATAPDIAPPDIAPPDIAPSTVSASSRATTRRARSRRWEVVTRFTPDYDDSAELEQFEARTWWASGLALLAFGSLTGAAAYTGALATRRSVDDWYASLDKPSFTPPNWVFGSVWSGMYTLTALSGWRVWRAPPSRRRTAALVLWGAQLLLNGAWSPLFFGRRQPRAALVDLVALTITTGAYALTAREVDRVAAAMVIPPLGWLGFAGALNEEIIRLNPPVPAAVPPEDSERDLLSIGRRALGRLPARFLGIALDDEHPSRSG